MSICQRALGLRPQGFTSNDGHGLNIGLFGHNLTICLVLCVCGGGAGYESHSLNQLHFDDQFCENFWPCPYFYVNLK